VDVQRLNLARKWRSQQFEEIVGQELAVRMLKNGLYLDKLFPVYLFSGQRGCGKTTTARVFSAALNCEQLPDFRANPKNIVVPCLSCGSCQAMKKGNHPDFIEMDAASHTGVDNVRMIVEAASLMPVMGNKKIYLIDEAHMLSKAAFNAFLKILEEPPEAVIFMLATTDPQKIIETVKSRCFQLFFGAIDADRLVDHLKEVCQKESIKAEEQALYTIVKETEGSARDALNLLEQVRFSAGLVSQTSVLKSLGHLSESQLLGILEKIVAADVPGLITYLQEIQFESHNALGIWTKFIELIRTALFIKYGAISSVGIENKERFEKLVRKASIAQLGNCLQLLYEQELLLLKTTVQHGLLEMVFLKMAGMQKVEMGSVQVATEKIVQQVSASSEVVMEKKTNLDEPVVATVPQTQVQQESSAVLWQQFVEKVASMSEPLLSSIFKQAEFISFDQTSSELVVKFKQDTGLFGEWLKETETVWMKFLKEIFGDSVQYKPQFSQLGQQAPLKKVIEKKVVEQTHKQPVGASPNKIVSPTAARKATLVDISDKEKWKKANQLKEAFGGTIIEVPNNEKTE
jgi:DNA polymerase-3 subunit gamma/tau